MPLACDRPPMTSTLNGRAGDADRQALPGCGPLEMGSAGKWRFQSATKVARRRDDARRPGEERPMSARQSEFRIGHCGGLAARQRAQPASSGSPQ